MPIHSIFVALRGNLCKLARTEARRRGLAPVRHQRYMTGVLDRAMVILADGRAAISPIMGVPSLLRQVASAERLGLPAVVVYPRDLQAMGVEIRGIVGKRARCCSAENLAQVLDELNTPSNTSADTSIIAMAADWYLSHGTVLSFVAGGENLLRARVMVHGRGVSPMGRLSRSALLRVCDDSAKGSTAGLLNAELFGSAYVEPNPRDCQRLGDDGASAAAEEKLLSSVLGPTSRLAATLATKLSGEFNLLMFRRQVIAMLARHMLWVSQHFVSLNVAETSVGLAAAYIVSGGGYQNAVIGSVLYFLVRTFNAAVAVAARASVRESARREMLWAVSDTLVQLAMLFAMGVSMGAQAMLAAAIAAFGLLVATALAWNLVLKDLWAAHSAGSLVVEPADRFLSRFVQRDPIAGAILFAAVVGRLDLFLWAAAISAHLFYIAWLLARRSRAGMRRAPA